MSIDHIIDSMMENYRMYYPYRAVRDLDMPAMVKCGMMIVGQLDLRYSPSHNMTVVRRIFEESPPEYFRLRNIAEPVSHAVNEVQNMLFNDVAFRERVLATYQMAVKPEIERYKAYNRSLEELTNLSLPYDFSLNDLSELTELYAEYRRLNNWEKQFYLIGLDPAYTHIIETIDRMERLYPDLIQRDLRNVPDKVYNSMGLGRYEIQQNEYGILFPYIHLVNRAKLIMAKYDELDLSEPFIDEPVPDFSYRA